LPVAAPKHPRRRAGLRLVRFEPMTFDSLARTFSAVACLSALSVLPSCAMDMPHVNPAPNIALTPQSKSLGLSLGEGVENELKVDGCGNGLAVHAWHESLQTGFTNGFRKAFPAAASPDLTLRIDQARVECRSSWHQPIQIQYAITLLGRDGSQRRDAGVASRAGAGDIQNNIDAVYLSLAASIDDMYEKLAKDLFPNAPVTPTAPACVPGQSSACVGPKGCQGFQVCANDGSRFEQCSCGN
jgi:hypothetical protein